MLFWILMAVAFLVVLALLGLAARHVREVEDDSSYETGDGQFTPYGRKFLNILRGRDN